MTRRWNIVFAICLAHCSKDQLTAVPPAPDEPVCELDALPQLTAVAECEAPPTGTFEPVVEWHWEPSDDFRNVMMTPVVANLTDDNGDEVIDLLDTPDVAVVMYRTTLYYSSGVLRVISGDGSGEHWSVPNLVSGGSGLAVGDIDNDGISEIVAINTNYNIVVFEHDGTVKWTSPAATDSFVPTIADLDGDGWPEVISGSHVYTGDGNLLWQGIGLGGGFSYHPSVAADVDGDGLQELFYGSRAWNAQGEKLWGDEVRNAGTAVADLDRDGVVEVIYSNGANILQARNALLGTVLWEVSTLLSGGPPTVADFDSDGLAEVGIASRDTYSVFDSDGTLLWENAVQDQSSGITGSAVFDFEGDGAADVVFADETKLWAFSGDDGSVKFQSSEHSSWTLTEYPVIADVDGDGQSEIVWGHSQHGSNITTPRYGISVLGANDGSWMPTRRIWNQHGYSITNVLEDGTIPAFPEPNWYTFNSFRSAALPPGAGSQVDLIVGVRAVCGGTCPSSFEVTLAVGNQGYLEVEPGVLVEIVAVFANETRVLATAETKNTILPQSWSENFTVRVPSSGVEGAEKLIARVDGGPIPGFGAWVECDEGNNTVELGASPCE